MKTKTDWKWWRKQVRKGIVPIAAYQKDRIRSYYRAKIEKLEDRIRELENG